MEQRPELASQERKVMKLDGRLYRETISGEQGPIWDKRIDYIRAQDPDTKEWTDTDVAEAVTERMFTRDDEGKLTAVEGTNLDREHSFKESGEFDADAKLINGQGEVTEGKLKGETWKTNTTEEPHGDFTKRTVTRSGKHFQGEELVDFEAIKTEYVDTDGTVVWGYKEETGNPASRMEWGKKPEGFEE